MDEGNENILPLSLDDEELGLGHRENVFDSPDRTSGFGDN